MRAESPGPPRILFIADEWPWPADNGYRRRLDNVVTALSSIAVVDYVGLLADEPVRRHPAPVSAGLREARAVRTPWVPGVPRRLGRWVRQRVPWTVSSRDWSLGLALLLELRERDYSLVWISHCEPLLALHDVVWGDTDTRVVVDVDTLPTTVLRSRLKADRTGWKAMDRLRCLVDRVDEPRWSRLERRLRARGDNVVLCSDLDRRRSGLLSAAVIPNGYPAPQPPAGPRGQGPPVIGFVGTMTYEPNREGARWLVEQVFPLLRRAVPDVRLRIIGSTAGSAEVRSFASSPEIEITGHVDDVTPHLADCSVVVAPINFGGGTRVKILEAFAHRVPVVSTSIGCEGLDVEDGRHLLVADGPSAFAAACARLLSDRVLADRIVHMAHDRYSERYRADRVQLAVVAYVNQVLADGALGESSSSKAEPAPDQLPRRVSAVR
jgi:glycosyltransferase involved in cell wall biosynthesis